ncbi:pyridine nucleotide-disulfide oxidoreductase, partial [Rhizoclosmatium globosum]
MSPAPLQFDVIVIGTGSGTKLVRPVAALGYKVAVIEKDAYGGTCLNRGCIPSKMLIHPADIISTLKDEAPKFGIQLTASNQPLQTKMDQKALIDHVCKEIDADSQSIPPMYDRTENLTRFSGSAEFIGERVVKVTQVVGKAETTYTITAPRVYIVTGCKASVLDVPGLQGTPYMTYREILRAPSTFESMIVIGGGYIACELGYYAARVGNTEVTFLVREKMLRGEDEEIRAEFEKEFRSKFNVKIGVSPTALAYENGEFHVTVVDKNGVKETLIAKGLLVATGVEPDTTPLHLETSGVKLDAKGFIKVNHKFETTCPGVYAFGDTIGRYLFKHSSNFEGEWLFNTQYAPEKNKEFIKKWVDSKTGGVLYPPMPHAVFSYPQIGGVGLTQEQAIEVYTKDGVIVGRADIADVAMGAALRATSGFTKLIFRKSDKQLVGAHMVGEQASVVIHMAIAYMNMNATLYDMVDSIYIHPALVEVLRDACRDARGQFQKLG